MTHKHNYSTNIFYKHLYQEKKASPEGNYCRPSLSETLAAPLYFEIAKWAAGTG
ncbi:MAG: hypothetical protein EZS28_044829, partial [Streblomastix strix]